MLFIKETRMCFLKRQILSYIDCLFSSRFFFFFHRGIFRLRETSYRLFLGRIACSIRREIRCIASFPGIPSCTEEIPSSVILKRVTDERHESSGYPSKFPRNVYRNLLQSNRFIRNIAIRHPRERLGSNHRCSL